MQITNQLAGRKVREVWRNQTSLVIRCEDGFELRVAWRNPETGEILKGEPVVTFAGKHLMSPWAAFNRREVPHIREG